MAKKKSKLCSSVFFASLLRIQKCRKNCHNHNNKKEVQKQVMFAMIVYALTFKLIGCNSHHTVTYNFILLYQSV